MILGITGHRPNSPSMGGYKTPNPTYTKIYSEIIRRFEILKPSKVISGMALGTDQWAADAAIELGIPFIAAVPFDGQESMWPYESKLKFNGLLDKADEVVIVSPGSYSPEKMHTRDRWIVDNSNSLLAVWSGIEKGGTYGTVRYAQKSITKGREDYEIFIINPDNL